MTWKCLVNEVAWHYDDNGDVDDDDDSDDDYDDAFWLNLTNLSWWWGVLLWREERMFVWWKWTYRVPFLPGTWRQASHVAS